MQFIFTWGLFVMVSVAEGVVDSEVEAGARQLLNAYHSEALPLLNAVIKLGWAYSTNITQHNRRRKEEADLEMREFRAEWYDRSRQYAAKELSPDTRRTMRMAFPAQLNPDDARNLSSLMSTMSQVYATATVCLPDQEEPCLPLEPDLSTIMATSRDYKTLSHVWTQWRDNVGSKIRREYLQYLDLMNIKARLDNYTDAGHMWRDRYESDTLERDLLIIYEELAPLYKLVHAYVRHRLGQVYEQIEPRGALPACVLGDMWGRFWMNIYPLVTPYPDQPDIDVSSEMVRQNYSVMQMFRMGEEYFTSMGLKPLPATFYTHSMLERPADGRDVACHPTAWDFMDGKDFRIKMCTKVNMEDLMTIHHELGHIQYFMQYAHQHITHRDGANDGFHEAIGELIAMVMSTPGHLSKMGLLHHHHPSHESTVNYLMRTALHTITTLPFHLVNDLWRWRAWRGEYQGLHTYNERFWQLKEKYLGVKPPVPRGPAALDPPSLYHIATSYDMIRYFTRTLLQFQLLESLCEAAGHTGPLYTCDFHGSHKAGQLLASGLAMGSSRPWQDVLEKITGQRQMTTSAILRYFQPLTEWLIRHNKENDLGVGWGDNWRRLGAAGPTEEPETTAGGGSCGSGGGAALTVVAVAVAVGAVW